MKYLCLICADASSEVIREAGTEQHFDEYPEFTEGIRKSGHRIGGNRLGPSQSGATLRARKGKVLTTDGPFAETKEQLGGHYGTR
jgi:hypothetical protein